MALLSITASKKITITCSLGESTARQVDQYAHFLKVPADDVVNKALEYVFAKDKDFQDYRGQNPTAQVPPALRVKKPVVAAQSTKGTRNRVEVGAK